MVTCHLKHAAKCMACPCLTNPVQVRFQYDKSAAFITQLVDPLAAAFKQVRALHCIQAGARLALRSEVALFSAF